MENINMKLRDAGKCTLQLLVNQNLSITVSSDFKTKLEEKNDLCSEENNIRTRFHCFPRSKCMNETQQSDKPDKSISEAHD